MFMHIQLIFQSSLAEHTGTYITIKLFFLHSIFYKQFFAINIVEQPDLALTVLLPLPFGIFFHTVRKSIKFIRKSMFMCI